MTIKLKLKAGYLVPKIRVPITYLLYFSFFLIYYKQQDMNLSLREEKRTYPQRKLSFSKARESPRVSQPASESEYHILDSHFSWPHLNFVRTVSFTRHVIIHNHRSDPSFFVRAITPNSLFIFHK